MTDNLKTSLSASVRVLIFILVALAGVMPAGAHDPGLSTAAVTIKENDIAIVLTFARKDVENLIVQSPSGEMAECPVLEVKLDDRVVQPRSTRIRHNDDVYEFYFHFPRDGGDKLSFRLALFENLPLGHRQFVTVTDDAGRSLSERMLSERDAHFEVPLPKSRTASAATAAIPTSLPQVQSLSISWVVVGISLGLIAAYWLIKRAQRFVFLLRAL